jgi:hypothetical protein
MSRTAWARTSPTGGRKVRGVSMELAALFDGDRLA